MSKANEPSLIRLARENGESATPQPIDLGARVRQLRKDRNWTLEQAANHAGLARSTLSKIENGQMSVTISGAGEAHLTTTYEHELLAASLRRKKMMPYRARIRARKFEEFDGWVRHEGEEFLYVLTGAVRLFTEFYEPVDMRRGDSAYYDAAMGHNVVSVSDDDATILWVTTLE